MCVIIDINIASDVLFNDPNYRLVRNAIYGGRLTVMYGGKLRDEYKRHAAVMDAIVELDRLGLARIVSDVQVTAEALKIAPSCCSDDEHIVGLARVCGARLLCSDDGDLQADFGSKKLIDKPRGKIFKDATHKHLLRNACEQCA